MILIFDIEATGLNPYKDKIIQLSWMVFDEDGNEKKNQDYFVKGVEPSHYNIEKCGITKELLESHGVEIEKIIEEFKNDLANVHTLVAHNIDFDITFIKALLQTEQNLLSNCKKICTMKNTTMFVGIQNHFGYKYPSLQELYKKIFGEEFENAHNALSDVKATAKCFFYLKKETALF